MAVVVVALAGAAALVINGRAPDPAHENRQKYIAYLSAAQGAVRDHLKDGESARFRNVVVSQPPGEADLVCGEVNGKNSFGAYAGFTRFVTAGGRAAFMEQNMPPGSMDKLWALACTNVVFRGPE